MAKTTSIFGYGLADAAAAIRCLPVEIFAIILDCLGEETSTLVSLLRTCKSLVAQVLPRLYGNIIFKKSWRVALFSITMLAQSEPVQHLKTLEFHFPCGLPEVLDRKLRRDLRIPTEQKFNCLWMLQEYRDNRSIFHSMGNWELTCLNPEEPAWGSYGRMWSFHYPVAMRKIEIETEKVNSQTWRLIDLQINTLIRPETNSVRWNVEFV